MSGYAYELENEKKNKKKSRRFTIFFHLILFGLFLYPFLTSGDSAPEYASVVEINFTDFEKQASKKSSQSRKSKLKKPVKKPAPVRAKEPKPQPKIEAAPQKKPVVTTSAPEPKIETSPIEKEVESKIPEPVPAPAPVEVPEEEEVVEDAAPAAPEFDGGSPDATATTGSGAGVGNNADGHADEANNGTAAEGNNGLDFSGDGLLTRPVIHRADVKKITEEEGKIVVNICVARSGRVVYTKYNEEESSITTTSIIRKAVKTAQEYRFEKDYTLPVKQCGKLTFIFDLD